MKLYIHLFLGMLIIIIISCQSKSTVNTTFTLPKVINTSISDSVKAIPFTEHFVSEVYPQYIGKFKFSDMIDINRKKQDTLFNKDYISEYDLYKLKDSFDVNGFEIIPDYNTSIPYPTYFVQNEYYPVYFVNSTSSEKLFLGKDGYCLGIQEAFEADEGRAAHWGKWNPIEYRGYDFCGNGRWGVIVHPNEFVVVLMKKYTGTYKTKLRVRFQMNQSIFVSKSFDGCINRDQFSIRDSSYLQNTLRDTDGQAAHWLLYGAFPRKETWAVKSF